MNEIKTAIKKPIPVEFIKLERTNMYYVHKFIYGFPPYEYELTSAADAWERYEASMLESGYMPLKTLESGEGTQNASFGDYILKGIDGECWPVKPDIFERTYNIQDDTTLSPAGEDVEQAATVQEAALKHIEADIENKDGYDRAFVNAALLGSRWQASQQSSGEVNKQLLDFALDFINKVDTGRARSVDSYNKAKSAIASLHTQQDKREWLNPALLPKESGEYLIMAGWYEEHQFRHISKFDADKSKWNTAYHVYAWQPLPTPPTK